MTFVVEITYQSTISPFGVIPANLVGRYSLTVTEDHAAERRQRKFLEDEQAIKQTDYLGFTMPTLDGHTIDFSKYKGKVVLLHFWSEWCAPCKREVPIISQLKNRYSEDSLVVIGVLSWNLDLAAARQFEKSFASTYPTVIMPKSDSQ